MRVMSASSAFLLVSALVVMTLAPATAQWTAVTQTPAEFPVHFKVAINHAPETTEKNLLPILEAISTPSSSSYGMYLSRDEVADLFTPTKHDWGTVFTWLYSHGIKIHQDFDARETLIQEEEMSQFSDVCFNEGDAFDCYVSAGTVNEMFSIEMHIWTQTTKNGLRHFVTRAKTDYSLPRGVDQSIDFVEGLSYLPRVEAYQTSRPSRSYRSRSGAPKTDPDFVATEVMDRLYNITSHQVNPENHISLAAIEFNGQGFTQSSLNFTEKMNGLTASKVYRVQGSNPGEGTESMLDVQMMAILVEGDELWFINYDLWIYQFFSNLAMQKEVPYVVSVSYGWAEWDQCAIVSCDNVTSTQYISRCNLEAMKLAFRGITVCVSSGDAGSPGRTNEECIPQNTTSSTQKRNMNPAFPGSSPYITSVGATAVLADPAQQFDYKTPMCKEYGCANGTQSQTITYDLVGWTSGGGFSVFDSETRPVWQSEPVEDYLNSGVKLPNETQWNRWGRGFPDVTANGHNCPVYGDMGSGFEPVDGTSCSSPVFASLLALANEHQIAKGCPRLGFVNPLLYLAARNSTGSFHQPIVTNTHSTEFTNCTDEFGFSAPPKETLWNPISGLGELNLGLFLEFLDEMIC